MNRSAFFGSLRARNSGVFGTSLSQPQVVGTEAILDSCLRNGVTNPHHVANILAQVYHETGGRMVPVRETFATSDAQAIARLDNAWKAGKLPWVRAPYWRDGAFGRGPIQITHWPMYEKMGKRLGVPLRQNPDLALDPKIGADIAVVGVSEGHFRNDKQGRPLKLSRYTFPRDLDNPPGTNPRRIVNGQDGTDAKVAGYHRAFHAALVAGGWRADQSAPPAPAKPAPAPTVPQPAPARPEPATGGKGGLIGFILFTLIVGGLVAANFLGFI